MLEILNFSIPAITAIIGMIIGAFLPHKLQEKSAYKTFKRTKIEELYSDINNWYNHIYSAYILPFYLVLKNEMDWNAYLDNINSSKMNNENIFFQSEIIITLYFKEIEDDFSKLTKEIQSLSSFINLDIKKAYKAGKDIFLFKSEFNEKVVKLNELAENFKVKLKHLARTI
jgi:hypothetical protein